MNRRNRDLIGPIRMMRFAREARDRAQEVRTERDVYRISELPSEADGEHIHNIQSIGKKAERCRCLDLRGPCCKGQRGASKEALLAMQEKAVEEKAQIWPYCLPHFNCSARALVLQPRLNRITIGFQGDKRS